MKRKVYETGKEKNITVEVNSIQENRLILKRKRSREKEAVDIMMVLHDQEETIQMYGESERYDVKIETAARMIADGDLSVEKIQINRSYKAKFNSFLNTIDKEGFQHETQRLFKRLSFPFPERTTADYPYSLFFPFIHNF